MLSEGNLIETLLPNYIHHYQLNPHFEIAGLTHCGLFPLCQSVNNVTTTGLKWNLSNQRMEYGALISTSNLINSEEITISADSILVWTTEFEKNSEHTT